MPALPASLADALRYLADLGWTEVYRRPPRASAHSASTQAATAVVAPPAAAPAAAVGADRLAVLAAEAASCTRCRLSEQRHSVVFADGNPHARLMLVGEGPGAEEDRRGLPFVGAAGGLLDRMLAAIGYDRTSVYIANVVKCRPPGNRDPQPDEVAACRGYLEAQIAAVRPQVLVCLGRVAARTLLGREESIARLRGHWHEVDGIACRVTYHPAALLRDGNLRRPTWEDLQLIRDRLSEAGAVE